MVESVSVFSAIAEDAGVQWITSILRRRSTRRALEAPNALAQDSKRPPIKRALRAILQTFAGIVGASLALAENASRSYPRRAVTSIFSDPDKFVKADPFPFFIGALIVLVFGPGRFSIDALIKRMFGQPRRSSEAQNSHFALGSEASR